MADTAGTTSKTEQVLVRVTPHTHAELQLAQPFDDKRSMQDLISSMIVEYLSGLETRDPGFAAARIALAESRARSSGELAKATPDVARLRRRSKGQ